MTDQINFNERYSRQIRLPSVGESGQHRLAQSTVLIIGMGGLGSPVALYLAAAGVGHMIIADFDQVDESNLTEAGHPPAFRYRQTEGGFSFRHTARHQS